MLQFSGNGTLGRWWLTNSWGRQFTPEPARETAPERGGGPMNERASKPSSKRRRIYVIRTLKAAPLRGRRTVAKR